MPTYDYRCGACGHELELFQSFSESPKRRCPECGRQKLARVIGVGGGIIFKGSGFYETDYRSDSYKKSAEAEAKAQDGSAPGGDEKKDEKKKEKSAEAKPREEKGGGSGTMKDGSAKASDD